MLARYVEKWEKDIERKYVEKWEKDIARKGRQEGEAKILTSMLQRRFSAIPEWASEKIAKADSDSLEAWSLRIFDARSLGDVFEEPKGV
ncbi:MAG: DUF4351 domain-containing protein [Nitrospirae bacterium]|nr:DUF4351 domain-containing protein [Magnetococcales bacterium]